MACLSTDSADIVEYFVSGEEMVIHINPGV